MTPTEMHIDALMDKIEKLESENARYREALERIANYGYGDGFNEFMSAIIGAQDALKGE